ncbi:hypothetical protein, partial [Halochromatium salexigens]|uniref:hypothetical protein n=1 Tax=Halochromatium salexigens TaxID=49447 RepID=UPI001A9159E2
RIKQRFEARLFLVRDRAQGDVVHVHAATSPTNSGGQFGPDEGNCPESRVNPSTAGQSESERFRPVL